MSTWQALAVVEAEAERHEKDLEEGDGKVITHGQNPDRDEEDDFDDGDE